MPTAQFSKPVADSQNPPSIGNNPIISWLKCGIFNQERSVSLEEIKAYLEVERNTVHK
jgi:hypothetical protein